MSIEIRVPEMGESIVEATVGKWLKQVGDVLNAGQAVVELETDKVNMEVYAEEAGILGKVLKEEGETVTIQDVLGIITDATVVGAANNMTTPKPANATETQVTVAQDMDSQTPSEIMTEHPSNSNRLTPIARRMVAEHGIDSSRIQGTGASDRITKEDVENYLARDNDQQAYVEPTVKPIFSDVPAREERIRLSRRRLTMAQRLTEAHQTAVMATTFNEVDMSAVIDIRRREREAFKKRYGVDLGFMSFFVKATVGGLKAFPQLNSELRGDEQIIKHYYDIGIAIGSDEGLVVPVLRDAEAKSFADIESTIADMAERAREHKLTLEEIQGGTFTITNGGVFGSLMSTPILSPPQVGILGMHRFQERPVVVNGQVAVRPMMYVALTYDHRIIEGREAVLCLGRIKELVEAPAILLLE